MARFVHSCVRLTRRRGRRGVLVAGQHSPPPTADGGPARRPGRGRSGRLRRLPARPARPAPPRPLPALLGPLLAPAPLVLAPALWRPARTVVTIAHEGAHGLVAL